MFQITPLRIVLFTTLLVAAIVSGNAQTRPTQDEEHKRLSFGGIVGYSLTGVSKELSTTVNTSQTDPPTVTDTIVNSAGAGFVGGGSLRYDIGERFGVGGDILYRRGGYDSNITLSEQLTNDDDGDLLLITYEETRAHIWEIPILGRYYFKDRSEKGMRPYLTGGLAMRFVSGLSTLSEITDDDQVTDTDLTPIGPANDSVLGTVAGFGIRASDDVGIKVDFEFRYTRWMDPIFQSGPANSNDNQADILVAFTF